MPQKERDYVLGTNKEELERLGLQHRIWHPHVLQCWQKTGITLGSKVLDIGAGPGYATRDLADIVGEKGKVVGVERSTNFVNYVQEQNKFHQQNIEIHELDIMEEEFPEGDFDFAWCRWVACFVSSPNILVEKTVKALKPGGRAIFHEYCNYRSWKLFPGYEAQEQFIEKVISSWRSQGGEPDIALQLPQMLEAQGMKMVYTNPHVFTIQPKDYMWNWVASFVDINLDRMIELGIADKAWTDTVRTVFEKATANPNSIMITPMVLEIVAEKM